MKSASVKNLVKGNLYSFHFNEFNFETIVHDSYELRLINFPNDKSLKVIPFYKKINPHEINLIIKKIEFLSGLEFKVDDSQYFEMICISAMKLLLEFNTVIIYTAGLTYESIAFLERLFSEITSRLNKIVIVIYNENRG